ncbi:MAG: hypothetical protein ACK47B_10090 [Armatimonadota bacterium]
MSRQSPTPGALSRRGVSLLAVSACAALLLLAGCDSARRSSDVGVSPAPATQAPVEEPPITDFAQLPTDDGANFVVKAEPRSKAVLEHYDREFKAKGWRRLNTARSTGQLWEWQPLPPGLGLDYSEDLEGAWVNPKTGETAVLGLNQPAKRKGVQEGTLDIYPKGENPWADVEE